MTWTYPAFPPEPLPPSDGASRVVVVGAGAAGLMAARMLVAAGYQVTVLEASTRAGGRIKTLTAPFSDGLHVDAGAAFIPCNHTYTVGLAKGYGLELRELVSSFGATRRDLVEADYVNGTLVRDPHNTTDWPVSLSDDEKGKTLGELGRMYFGDALQQVVEGPDPRDPTWPPPELAALDQVSFLDLLRRNGASSGAVDILRLGLADLWGEGVAAVSALWILRDLAMFMAKGGSECAAAESSHHPGVRLPRGFRPHANGSANNPQFALVGGNEGLPNAMADELKEHIRYRSMVRVVRVEDDGTVSILFDTLAERAVLQADRVLVAVPASVLGRIQFFPSLSDGKRRAFAEFGQTSVARVFFEFKTRFWEKAGLAGGCYTDLTREPQGPDAPGLWINNQTYAQDTDRGILEVYTVGSFARWLSDQPQEKRTALLLEQVETVFPGAKDAYDGYSSWFWEYDPGAVCGYPYAMPGQLTRFGKELGRAEGPIHFAGDHTSALPGWIQGALESGVRAAREVGEGLERARAGSAGG